LVHKKKDMPAIPSNKFKSDNVVVVKKMKDYSKDPFFRKKAEEAMTFLKKYGLPDSFKKKGS
jgi:hypothetical protein